MVNFGNVAVSQKYNVHEIIAHFSPIVDKKISSHFRKSFFSPTDPKFVKVVLNVNCSA
jgi:hypothetical protein